MTDVCHWSFSGATPIRPKHSSVKTCIIKANGILNLFQPLRTFCINRSNQPAKERFAKLTHQADWYRTQASFRRQHDAFLGVYNLHHQPPIPATFRQPLRVYNFSSELLLQPWLFTVCIIFHRFAACSDDYFCCRLSDITMCFFFRKFRSHNILSAAIFFCFCEIRIITCSRFVWSDKNSAP